VFNDNRFTAYSNGHIIPNERNDLITAHGVSGPTFVESHCRVSQNWKFRIVMPTNDLFAPVASASLQLLGRYWPEHPPVDVICRGGSVPEELAERQIRSGDREGTSWCAALRSYLQTYNSDELLLLMLDDYWLLQPVDRSGLAAGQHVLLNDPDLASFALTWQPTQALPYERAERAVVFQRWAYSVNTQAALWRRASLLRLLQAVPDASIEQFELSASAYHNQHLYPREKHAGAAIPVPPDPSDWVDDTDKTMWVFAYHNLMHRGAVDSRHRQFLATHGITLQ
jgi:hypothetical protein